MKNEYLLDAEIAESKALSARYQGDIVVALDLEDEARRLRLLAAMQREDDE